MSKRLVATVIGRGGIQVFKAMDNQSKSVVVIGVLRKNEENTALLKEMNSTRMATQSFFWSATDTAKGSMNTG